MSSSTGGTDLSSAFSSGSSGVGSNSFGFSMPSDFSAGSGDSFAGLSGIGSGMSLPSASAGSNSFGFSMPGAGGMSLPGLSNALGGASKTLQSPTTSQQRSGSRGAPTLRPENFTSPVVDYLPASGSNAGDTLIQLLQKYRVGAAS